MPPRFEPPSPRSPRRFARSRRGSGGEPRRRSRGGGQVLGGRCRDAAVAAPGMAANGRTPSTDVDVDVGNRIRRERGKVAVPAALADALPATYARRRARTRTRTSGDGGGGGGGVPAAAPNVVFRHATGERTPAHAAILAARCPALLRGVARADADRRDGSSSPGTTVRSPLGAGVRARAFLAVALTWASLDAARGDRCFAAIDAPTSDDAQRSPPWPDRAVSATCDATLRRTYPRSAPRAARGFPDLEGARYDPARHSDLRLSRSAGRRAWKRRTRRGRGRRGRRAWGRFYGRTFRARRRDVRAIGVLSRERSLRSPAARPPPPRGFLFDARDASSSVSTPSALAALRDACYSGVFPRPTRRGDRRGRAPRGGLSPPRVGIPHDGRGGGLAPRRGGCWQLERDGGSGGGDPGSNGATTLRRWAEAASVSQTPSRTRIRTRAATQDGV